MDTRSTLNNKIRKSHIRIVVYVLMLMMLRGKTKICTMVKYKRSRSLTFTVQRFLFSIATGEEFDQFDEITSFITSMIKPRILSANEAPYLL
jgi:hypothetical protein